MKPDEPNTLIASAVGTAARRIRFVHTRARRSPMAMTPYDPIKKWGPGSGLYKTTDGGRNWKKLSEGLPTNDMGRIGRVNFYQKRSQRSFLHYRLQAKTGMGNALPKPKPTVDLDIFGEEADRGIRLTTVRENGPSAKAGLMEGDVIQTINGEVDRVFRMS